mgnify:CR=1 FL=1
MSKLRKGVAYHGNRILKHVHEDMLDIIDHDFNLVVHMFSHTDWDRHKNIMKEIVAISEGYGLEVWIDNWGLGGPPGDKSHFLSYHPDCHQIFSDGTRDPVHVCMNREEFRSFTKEWIDAVEEIGGRKIFWDEPRLIMKENREPPVWTCYCEKCRGLFEERYGKPMPRELTPETEAFRVWTLADYFREVTTYSSSKGMENIVCVMLEETYGIHLGTLGEIARLDHLDNIGSDPYWGWDGKEDPYSFVYEATRRNLEICKRYGKEHNIWIQGYGTKPGMEEEIVQATDAAYDAGARTILVWGYRGSESNDYRAVHPDMTWKTIGDAMRRITEKDREAIRLKKLDAMRTKFGLAE